jgi:hypothetical protein
MSISATPTHERRGSIRIPADSTIRESSWCEAKDGLWKRLMSPRTPAQITDVSEGGISFLTTCDIDTGTIVSIEVAYKEYRPFMMKGRVRRTLLMEDPSKEEGIAYYMDENRPKQPPSVDDDKQATPHPEYYLVHIQFQHCDPSSMDEYKRMLMRLKKIHNIEQA